MSKRLIFVCDWCGRECRAIDEVFPLSWVAVHIFYPLDSRKDRVTVDACDRCAEKITPPPLDEQPRDRGE